jgi:hypothetical protein
MVLRSGGPVFVPVRSAPWHTAQFAWKRSSPAATIAESRGGALVGGELPPPASTPATMTTPAPIAVAMTHQRRLSPWRFFLADVRPRLTVAVQVGTSRDELDPSAELRPGTAKGIGVAIGHQVVDQGRVDVAGAALLFAYWRRLEEIATCRHRSNEASIEW